VSIFKDLNVDLHSSLYPRLARIRGARLCNIIGRFAAAEPLQITLKVESVVTPDHEEILTSFQLFFF
jgi:hypothetical protein